MSTLSTKSTNHTQTKKTATVLVPKNNVGLVISNMVSIARFVGEGCYISFDRGQDNRATIVRGMCAFYIQGWGQSVGRAQIKITQLLSTKTKPTKTTKTTTTKTPSQFSVLQDSDTDTDSDSDEAEDTSEKPTVDAVPKTRQEIRLARNADKRDTKTNRNFTNTNFKSGGIATLKKESWQRRKAFQECEQTWNALPEANRPEWEAHKRTHMNTFYASTPTPTPTPKSTSMPRAPKSTSGASGAVPSITTPTVASIGVWGKSATLEGVKQEAPVVKPKSVERKSLDPLRTLTHQVSTPDSWDDEDSTPVVTIAQYATLATPDDWNDSVLA